MTDQPAELTTGIFQHKRHAEQLFAAAVFLAPAMANELAGWLRPDAILDRAIASFWEKVKAGNGSPESAIAAAMDAGIYTAVLGWSSEVASTLAVGEYARQIAQDNYLVAMADNSARLARSISKRDIDGVNGAVAEIGKAQPETGSNIPNAIDIGMDFAERLYDPSPDLIKTGIANLDGAIGGMERRKLTILAARPSMGKTSLAWQIGRSAAQGGQRVCYCSIEMTADALWQKAVYGGAKVDRRDYLKGKLTDKQREALSDVNSALIDAYSHRLTIEDSSYQTIEVIWQRAAAVHPDLLVVDHIGLIVDKEPNLVIKLGVVTWGLKSLAKELNCHVLALCQLSRAVEGRDNKRPQLSDLRSSGDIEQNADNVWMLYRDDYYKSDDVPPPESETEIIIAKYREGVRNIRVKTRYVLAEQWFYAKEQK